MLQPASLDVPKTGGRSRFSKALPAIPPIDTSPPPQAPSSVAAPTSTISPPPSAPTPGSSKPFSAPRIQADLPPPPTPPHNDDPRVPIQFTPLPPLPKKKAAGTSVSSTPPTPVAGTPNGTPKMTIPRRPVGSKSSSQNQVKTPKAEPSQQSTKAGPQPQKAEVTSPVKSPEKELPTPQFSKMQMSSPLSPPGKELPMPQGRKMEQVQGSGQGKLELKSGSQLPKAQSPLPPPPVEKELPVPQEQNTRQEASQPKPQQEPRQEPRQEQALPPVPPKSVSRSESQRPSPPPMLSPPQQSSFYDPQYQQPLKSPSESLSSLLSAYSRSSTESVVRSSDGTAYSAVESRGSQSQSYSSPEGDGPPPPSKDSGIKEDKESLKTVTQASFPRRPTLDNNGAKSSPLPPPPPPSKDSSAQHSNSPARGSEVGQDLGAASPPRQQIWRRRSFKGSRELPNLHLDFSHGSTASTSSISTITPAKKPAAPAKSAPISDTQEKAPAKSNAESAGRELAPETPAKDKQKMGHGTSKMRQLKNKFHISRRSDDSTKSTKSDQSGPMVNRPPTPEYQKEDVKTPVLNTFISPVSPASSPEPPQKESLDMSKSQAGRQSGASSEETEAKPMPRKAVPTAAPTPASTQSAAPPPALHSAKSLPDLKKKAPPARHEPMPSVSSIAGRNSPAPDMAPRGRQPGPPGAFPPSSRNTSARPSSRGSVRPGGPSRFSGPEPERWARSSSGDLCYKGRDGTLYPEMREDPNDPDPKAMQFPMNVPDEPHPEGTIFKAVPLKDSHFNCYQRHKTMLRRANKRYPLACQICEKQDSEDRFSCNFCYVKMCTDCLATFETKGRDLKALQNELANNGTLSLSSTDRPGSALGLQITF